MATIGSALKGAGHQRNIAARAHDIQTALRSEQLVAPEAVVAAFGATTTAAVQAITTLNDQIAELETVLAQHFETHPDADIYRSLSGLGVILGTRVLGEPLTVASGKKRAVAATSQSTPLRRDRDQWSFCVLS